MARDRDITDDDKQWKASLKEFVDVERLEIRVGVLSGRPKYPEERGGTAVAKVAGVQYGFAAMTEVWDKGRGKLDRELEAVHKWMTKGRPGVHVIVTQIAERIRNEIRQEIETEPNRLVNTGLLSNMIRGAVYLDRKWKYGDHPTQ